VSVMLSYLNFLVKRFGVDFSLTIKGKIIVCQKN